MTTYIVTPEFKTRATDILKTKKFASVFQYMNLINREGNLYREDELNALTQLLSEFSYTEVSEFFALVPQMVKKQDDEATSAESQKEETATA
jgi:hypothetical protein